MTRTLALASARPDATGSRWAKCVTCERTYVCVRHPDGQEIIEVRGGDLGPRRARRIAKAPRYLVWQPVHGCNT